MKIAIIAIENINNVGDELLGANTNFLISRASAETEMEVCKIQLRPNKNDLMPRFFINYLVSKIFYKISDFLPNSDLKYKIKNFGVRIRYTKYFKEKINDVDKIIYAIGMLKYSTQQQSYPFNIINKLANERNISVMMSAMSIEFPNERDWRFRLLREAVNYDCVKVITTRDNDDELNVLRENYLYDSSTAKISVVGDPALWTASSYDVIKESKGKNKFIGIGLIRLGIFEDYDGGISKRELYDFYKELIIHLQTNGVEYRLFCNGITEDYEVGLRLLKDLRLKKDILMPRPRNAEELINILSYFRAVFGARLHSCITSYAMGIPVVGLIWDNKLRAFAKKIKWEKYFVERRNMNASYVLDKLVEVSLKKYNNELFNELKVSTLESFKNFLRND